MKIPENEINTLSGEICPISFPLQNKYITYRPPSDNLPEYLFPTITRRIYVPNNLVLCEYVPVVDCDDSDKFTYPGAYERCDYKDNDCDEQTDEGVKPMFFMNADGDGYGNPSISTKDYCNLLWGG